MAMDPYTSFAAERVSDRGERLARLRAGYNGTGRRGRRPLGPLVDSVLGSGLIDRYHKAKWDKLSRGESVDPLFGLCCTLTEFCELINRKVPTNVSSFQSRLDKASDVISVNGETLQFVVRPLNYRGKFRPIPDTKVFFRVVPAIKTLRS